MWFLAVGFPLSLWLPWASCNSQLAALILGHGRTLVAMCQESEKVVPLRVAVPLGVRSMANSIARTPRKTTSTVQFHSGSLGSSTSSTARGEKRMFQRRSTTGGGTTFDSMSKKSMQVEVLIGCFWQLPFHHQHHSPHGHQESGEVGILTGLSLFFVSKGARSILRKQLR